MLRQDPRRRTSAPAPAYGLLRPGTWARRHTGHHGASALDPGPGLGPLRVVDAVVATADQALLRGCRPVPDLVGVGLVLGVEGRTVLLHPRLRARLALGRRLAEPLRHLRVDRRRDDPVHPLVRAGGVLGL